MYRILYLAPGPMPPTSDSRSNKFTYLSNIAEGDVLQPTWWRSSYDIEKELGTGANRSFTIGSFNFHFKLDTPFGNKLLNSLSKIYFYISTARNLYKSNSKYDFIISYGANITGLSALFIKILYGGKLIIEIPGVPAKGSLYDSPESSLLKKMELFISNLILKIISLGTDHFKLLYPSQLSSYSFSSKIPCSVFHEFVPTSQIQQHTTSDEKYILFIGAPWYLKGVDILIKSFHSIKDTIPDYKLKIVGWFPDKSQLIELRNEEERIEIFGPEPSNSIFDLIAKCSMLILPSRMEAMGRVLLEAMSLEKPLIGSNVDGIPSYIDDGINGLLFNSEEAEELSQKILLLINDNSLSKKFGDNGKKMIKEKFNEDKYVSQFKEMLDNTV